MQTHQRSSFFLKAQTRTHPSGSQSGRSAAIPLRSRSQTTLPRHPLPRSAQHLRALGPPAPAPTPAHRSSPPRAARCALGPPAPAPTPARGSSRAQACARPRSRALGAAPLPRAGSPAPPLRPARARAAAREGGAEVDLGLDFSGEWNREQRGNKRARGTTREETQRKGKRAYLQPVGSISVIF